MPAGLAERITDGLEPLGERLNPILVKEVRQALRSRRFIIAFMLALVASLAATLIGLLIAIDGELDPQAGKMVFMGLFICFTVIAMVIVPFEVQARHMADRTHAEVDLVQITRLSAYRILSGKLQAAGVTLVLYLSALVPFSTFSYLLKGVTPAMIGIGLLVTAAAGFTAINFVLFASTFVTEKRGMGGATFLCLMGAFWVISAGVGLVQLTSSGFMSTRDLWVALGLSVAGTVALNVVLFTTTAARMSFSSANKETGPRLALFGTNVYLVGLTFAVWALSGYDDEVLLGVTIAALAWWALVGYFVLAVPIETNERIGHSSPRFALFGYLFWPGRGRAYFFYLLNLALLCVPAIVGYANSAVPDARMSYAVMSSALYAASFPGVPVLVFAFTRGKWGWPRNLVKATGVFIVCYYVALHLVLWVTFIAITEVSGGRPEELAPLHALSPPVGVGFLLGVKGWKRQLLWNVVVALVALVPTFIHFAPLAAKDLAESLRLAAARRRGEFDEPPQTPASESAVDA